MDLLISLTELFLNPYLMNPQLGMLWTFPPERA